jgi:hypothetical protein
MLIANNYESVPYLLVRVPELPVNLAGLSRGKRGTELCRGPSTLHKVGVSHPGPASGKTFRLQSMSYISLFRCPCTCRIALAFRNAPWLRRPSRRLSRGAEAKPSPVSPVRRSAVELWSDSPSCPCVACNDRGADDRHGKDGRFFYFHGWVSYLFTFCRVQRPNL